MARITIYHVGEVKTSAKNTKYVTIELMKTNGFLTKRTKSTFFEQDVDIEAVSKAKKGDLFGIGELATRKVEPYPIVGADGVERMVETATRFIADGEKEDVVFHKSGFKLAGAPAAPALVLQSANAAAPDPVGP